MTAPLAISPFAVRAEFAPAPPLSLHGDYSRRCDSNCPVQWHAGRTWVFGSHFLPRGHTYRRAAGASLASLGPVEPVTLLDDPDPAVGKWIESTWSTSDGRLYGWYHAEPLAPCLGRRRVLPHIGAVVSDDDGLNWRCLGVLLQAPEGLHDCGYLNGYFAGGYGDFSVVSDRIQAFLYLYFTSYIDSAQGIGIARYPVEDRDQPAARLQLWREGGWHAAQSGLPTPLWPPKRSWRHLNPVAFWGPAVHFNRDLGLYVMLVNHTSNGRGDWRQEGIYLSFNDALEDAARWSPPMRILKGGDWYPQVVGLGPEDGDAIAGAEARFFMAGASRWRVRFTRDDAAARPQKAPHARRAPFARPAAPLPD